MRVLVVEDDLDLRDALAESLAESGFTVAAASDGSMALELLQSAPPDVVLLDLVMKGMDGWSFRREQRARSAASLIPVVAMTGLTGVARVEPLDVDALLVKPFTLEELVSAIDQVVEARRGRRRGT